MKHEKSCGAVVFTKDGNERRYVIVESIEGYHGFPKGHAENGETEEETALREIFEETGLRPQIVKGFRMTDEHPIADDILKTIVYFLARYDDQNPVAQKSELNGIDLMTREEAMAAFEFESSKRILAEADAYLSQTPTCRESA